MNKLILVSCLILAVSYVTCQTAHCIADAFATRSILVDPSKDVDDENRIWYDAKTNKQRTDVIVIEPEPARIQIFQRHDLNKVIFSELDLTKVI